MNKQEHLLACLAEEAGEIVQAVGKAFRFGLKDGYPETNRTNEKDIQTECNHLIAVMEMLIDSGLGTPCIATRDRDIVRKKYKVIEFMGHARSTGALTD